MARGQTGNSSGRRRSTTITALPVAPKRTILDCGADFDSTLASECLDAAKPLLELEIGLVQRKGRVNTSLSTEVHAREQQIAKL